MPQIDLSRCMPFGQTADFIAVRVVVGPDMMINYRVVMGGTFGTHLFAHQLDGGLVLASTLVGPEASFSVDPLEGVSR